jgi:threonine synthase
VNTSITKIKKEILTALPAKKINMKYYSLNHQSAPVSFKEATITGQAPDKGLYFPERIPEWECQFVKEMPGLPAEEIAFRIMQPYAEGCIPEEQLRTIVAETINFPLPLVKVTDNITALELYHGPTLAFKDVGARFMSRCLGYFSQAQQQKTIVLVATSGDTGGAVAHGFHNVEGVEVVILYPSGKVSKVQEQQLTTLGGNVQALEVEGSFDDCQQLVKQAFADVELNQRLKLTSANSINIARWLPQQLYYALAYKQWPHETPPVIAVPSGNFGNLAAGMLAQRSGLPVQHFIAACNANDVVPRYFTTGQYEPHTAIATISNAMDVGNPSNFVRILEMYKQYPAALPKMLSAQTVSDDQTRHTLQHVYTQHQYLCDPHGAVAYACLHNYLSQHPGQHGLFLETAHPVKFYDVVEPVIGAVVPLPASLEGIMGREKKAAAIGKGYEGLREWLGEGRV